MESLFADRANNLLKTTTNEKNVNRAPTVYGEGSGWEFGSSYTKSVLSGRADRHVRRK
jgi:hypothetical protein